MPRILYLLTLTATTILTLADASHYGTTDLPFPEGEPSWTDDDFPSGEPTPESEGETTPEAGPEGWTTPVYNDSSSHVGNLSAAPDGFAKFGLQRVGMVKQRIVSAISNFYQYQYDSWNNGLIGDGGHDMYDGGNKVYFSAGDGARKEVQYGHYYESRDDYEFGSTKKWPFTALMYINNTFGLQNSYSIQVSSDTGADGSGYSKHFSGGATNYGANVAYSVAQVYGAHDPTICEVYFAFSKTSIQSVEESFITSIIERGTGTLNTVVTLTNSPRNVWMGYMLLSNHRNDSSGTAIPAGEIQDAVGLFVSAVLGFGPDEPIPFNFTLTSTPGATTSYMSPTAPSITAVPAPVGSPIRRAFEGVQARLRFITGSISGFYNYNYDGGNTQINDGGGDMYDNGNQVYFGVDGKSNISAEYGSYYSLQDTYEFYSLRTWPFVALMHINNTYFSHYSFSIQVTGNAGADHRGFLMHYSNNATSNGINVVYTVTQVYNAGDPSICEVYFAFSQNGDIEGNFVQNRNTYNTDQLDSGITLQGYPQDAWLGYMLLSKSNGREVYQNEVNNAVSQFVSGVFGFGYTIPFNFTLTSTPGTTTSYMSPTAPSTTAVPAPVGSPIRRAFQGVQARLRFITGSISGFYNYNYDGGNTQINDGGGDMYDNGNQVYFGVDGESNISAEYGSYYSLQDTYEFYSLRTWPFVALMHINNTYFSRYSFSIQVTGNAGADHSGTLVHYSSKATSNGINVVYTVTQVYNAGDPSICEVYFAFSQNGDIEGNFVQNKNTYDTDQLDSGITLQGYPQDAWLGYMLLSKSNGREVYQNEVNNAVSQFVSGVFGFGYTIHFNFPYSPTEHPPTTTASTFPPYQQRVYVGFRQEVCGKTKFFQQNITQCSTNQTAFVTSVVVDVATALGYSYPVEGTISGCVESDLCYEGCSRVGSIIGHSHTVLSCKSRCCFSSYCNYHYDPYYYLSPPSNFTPPNITIPALSLPDVSVEVFPNCYFKPLASRLMRCANKIFDAWPFSGPSSCKSSILTGVQCGIQELSVCKTRDMFSSAMLSFPTNINWNEISTSLDQTGYLDIMCVHPAANIRNATISYPGPYNNTYFYPLFPQYLIGAGEPYCDKFIVDSLLDWGIEFLSVLKTSTSRFEMCRAYKLVINRVLGAAGKRCNLDMLALLFPCDSVLRNQLRALIAQAKEVLPNIFPDYCEGVNPPTQPETPDDTPFLPSCTLRQAIKSAWSCESVFTSKMPYSDGEICRTNINRLLHCVANRLQECNRGTGFSVFDALSPFVHFEDILATIRSRAQPVGCNVYGRSSDFRQLLCSSSVIDLSPLNHTLGNVFGLCRSTSSDVFQKIAHAYYNFAGARNSADVCMAYRSARSSIYNFLKNDCDFGLLQYLLPINSTARNVLSHGIQIVIKMLPELDISACPEPPATNTTFTSTRWLRSYVRWRSHALPKWQAAFENWRSEQDDVSSTTMPACLDLTGIVCKKVGMKLCESDYLGCAFCYCSDHKYKGLTNAVLQPWLQDYENWENFQTMWETKFQEWQEDNEQ